MLNVTIREMQINTIMRYHLTPVRMAITEKVTDTRVGKAAEKGDVLHVQESKDGSVKSFLQRNEKSEGGQGSVGRKDQG